MRVCRTKIKLTCRLLCATLWVVVGAGMRAKAQEADAGSNARGAAGPGFFQHNAEGTRSDRASTVPVSQAPEDAERPQAGAASEDAGDQDGEVTLLTVGSAMGLRVYRPERWGLVRVSASNDTDRAEWVEVGAHVRDAPDLRYARKLWVPPQSIRASWVPLYLPEERQPERAAVVSGSTGSTTGPAGDAAAGTNDDAANGPVVNAADGSENANVAAGGDAPVAGTARTREVVGWMDIEGTLDQGESRFLVRTTRRGAMAYIDDVEPRELRPQEKYMPYEMVLAARQSLGLDRAMSLVNDRLLPPVVEGWDAIGHVVLVGDRLDRDTAATTALRHWVGNGGRLWVQLNTVSHDTLRALLGSAYDVEEVDRVELAEFDFSVPAADVTRPKVHWEPEQPAELVRVLYDRAEPLFEIDGWPAALAIPFGRGEVLVTTLSPAGWVRSRGPNDPPYRDPRKYTDYMPSEPLADLATRFLGSEPVAPIDEELQANYVTQRIGYQIPSRGFVVGMLLLFCGGLGAVGWFLSRRQQLEQLSWISVILGGSVAAVIVMLSWTNRQAVPPTASYYQIIQVLPETGEYASEGTLAVYQPERGPAELRSSDGGRIQPDLPELRGSLRQLLWEDAGKWSWGETVLPSGIQLISTRRSGVLPVTPRVVGRFTSSGLAGSVDGVGITDGGGASGGRVAEQLQLSDGVLFFPLAAPLAANLQADGRFTAGAADRLASGQFFNETFLDEEQRRRKEMFAAYAEYYRQLANPLPMLVAWSEPLVGRMEWPERMRQTGAALVALPLEFAAAEPGSEVEIPDSLIECRSLLTEQGQSTVYDNRLRRWNFPNSQASVTQLRFQLPAAALPVELKGGEFMIDCNIPSRTLRVGVVRSDGSIGALLERRSAAGRIRIPISSAEANVDDSGALVLQIEVGPLERDVEEATMSNSAWTIRETTLDVRGTVMRASEIR